jgi:hypothetical protein
MKFLNKESSRSWIIILFSKLFPLIYINTYNI